MPWGILRKTGRNIRMYKFLGVGTGENYQHILSFPKKSGTCLYYKTY